jgi:hypothetical protein
LGWEAFDIVDGRDENMDGEVEAVDLQRELQLLMKRLQVDWKAKKNAEVPLHIASCLPI